MLEMDLLAGAGEMSDLIRAYPWQETPIGAPSGWSPALRTVVRIVLANRFPMLLWWGPEYISIYNDAYRPILGDKHPWGLGRPVRECWSEIWNVLKPLIDAPFHGGPATWSDDIELEINRSGFIEETHFTIAYSPVPDETAPGGIGGVLATVHEITEKIIGQRRTAILRDLGTGAANAKHENEACAIAAAALETHTKDVPFSLLYLISADGQQARLAAISGFAPGSDLAQAAITLDEPEAAAWRGCITEVLRTEKMVLVDDLSSKFGSLRRGFWPVPPHSAAVLPIRSNIPHQLSGFLVAGLSPRLRFDAEYKNFLDFAASQIATAIANARAYEEERKRAEALAEIDRAKTKFFSNVSHEFRTPLTLMLGPLEEVLNNPDHLGPGHLQKLEIAHRSSLRLLRLVNSLLDFSRIEAGRMKASYAPVDLSSVTADLASNFRSAVEGAGLKFIVDCCPLSEPVYVDSGMWEKIVLNLLSNAFKFTLDGHIAVRLQARDDRAVLTVADTGAGIPDAELPHIFERFHRVEGVRGRAYDGTGIGLALVSELVKLHGGTVDVKSKVGEGAVFTVSIPLGTMHLPPERISLHENRQDIITAKAEAWLGYNRLIHPAADTPAPPDAHEGRRGRIILADDNEDMREHVRHILTSAYEIVAVPDGRAALDAARQNAPDLVIADVMMPHLDGFALLSEIRGDPKLRELPVLLLSARAGEEARTEGITAGADEYISKPFSAKELIARVQTTLELHRIRHDAREQFEALLSQAPVGVYLVDADFRIRHVNPIAQAAFKNIPTLSVLIFRRFRTFFGPPTTPAKLCNTSGTRLKAVTPRWSLSASRLASTGVPPNAMNGESIASACRRADSAWFVTSGIFRTSCMRASRSSL
jgi:signal transduction histidine kinase/CheY-like chemotaxis protein